MQYEITSASNERIKRLVRLRDRRHREAEGVFIVEGPRLVDRALQAGLQPVAVYFDGSTRVEGIAEAVAVEPSVLSKASYRRKSEGIIAVFEQLPTGLDRLDVGTSPLLLVAESIEKPGNLGAMLRTAEATRADGFVAVGEVVDPFNPNAVRSSTGAVFSLPLAVCDMAQLQTWLGNHSISLVAATPGAPNRLWDSDLTRPCALMVGAEDTGLSAEALEAADTLVAVPMAGSADSLNASATLAIMAFEAVRQRSISDR